MKILNVGASLLVVFCAGQVFAVGTPRAAASPPKREMILGCIPKPKWMGARRVIPALASSAAPVAQRQGRRLPLQVSADGPSIQGEDGAARALPSARAGAGRVGRERHSTASSHDGENPFNFGDYSPRTRAAAGITSQDEEDAARVWADHQAISDAFARPIRSRPRRLDPAEVAAKQEKRATKEQEKADKDAAFKRRQDENARLRADKAEASRRKAGEQQAKLLEDARIRRERAEAKQVEREANHQYRLAHPSEQALGIRRMMEETAAHAQAISDDREAASRRFDAEILSRYNTYQ